MALTASNVRVGITGGISFGPLSSTLPTDPLSAIPTGFVDVGYIGEDGVTENIEADSNAIKAWQNGDTVRTIQTSHDVSFEFTMIETSDATLAVYYADEDATVEETKITGAQSPRKSWIIDVVDGDEAIRLVIPDGQITDRGGVTYQTEDAIGYPVTLTAYPDKDGVKAYRYQGSEPAPDPGA